MNILLLNLTRFGDLLQSQAAIAELALQGHQVGVVCLEPFAGVASLLRHVSYVSPVPGTALLAALDSPVRSRAPLREGIPFSGWSAALARLADWKEQVLREFLPDRVDNLTPTLPARLLGRFLAQDKPFIGFALDAFGFGLNTNGWAAFLQGAGSSRGISPFNVVDLFRLVTSPPATDASEPGGSAVRAQLCAPPKALCLQMRSLLDVEAPVGTTGYVGFQLGASEERRRWPVRRFVALGETLWREQGLCPVLLGSKDEAALAKAYAETAGHPFVNLCGATNLVELAATVTHLRLMVSNDTGTLHLAAGLGLPVLGIFLATAQPFDTGPYREGACSLEPDLDCHPCSFGQECRHGQRCREAISPAFVADLCLGFLRTGEWSLRQPVVHAAEKGRAWLSRFDEQGGMALVSLSGHGNEDRTIWLAILRHNLRRFIDRKRDQPFQYTPLEQRRTLSAPKRAKLSEQLRQAIMLLEVLREWGKTFTVRPLPQAREKFLTAWRRVTATLKADSDLGAIAVLWTEDTQGEGQDLPHLLLQSQQYGAFLTGLLEEINYKV